MDKLGVHNLQKKLSDEINRSYSRLSYKFGEISGNSYFDTKILPSNKVTSGKMVIPEEWTMQCKNFNCKNTKVKVNVNNLYFDFDKEFESLPQVYSTPEINITVTEETKFKLIEDLKGALKNPPADFPKIKDIITVDGVRAIFDKGWGLVRASNTTPKLVTRFEADIKENAKVYEDALINLFNTLKGR